MVYNDGISFHERQLIVQLRAKVWNELPQSQISKSEEDQDLYLLRWIRARENNLEKATDMLLKSLKWRSAHKVDSIFNVEPHPFFVKNFPYTIAGADKNGHPVVLVPFSEWDLRKAAKIPGALQHFESFTTRYLETVMERIKNEHENRSEGHIPITQALFVLDCQNFPYGQLLNLGAIRNMITLAGTYEAHYPEIIYKAMFLNCPSYFGMVIAAIKPVSSPKTMGKLCLYPSMTKWKKEMIEMMDPAILPERYGGTAANIDYKNY